MTEDDAGPGSEDERLDARLSELLCLMRDRHVALHPAGAESSPVPDLSGISSSIGFGRSEFR